MKEDTYEDVFLLINIFLYNSLKYMGLLHHL